MRKKLNVFALALLILGQTILGPIGTASASEFEVPVTEPETEAVAEQEVESVDSVDIVEEADSTEPKESDSTEPPSEESTPADGDDSEEVGTDEQPEANETEDDEQPSDAGEGLEEELLDGDVVKEEGKAGFGLFGLLGAETGTAVADSVMNVKNLEIGHLHGAAATVTAPNYFLGIDNTKFGPENTYYVKFDFSLAAGHDVQPGDYYEFQVPTAFQLTEINNRNLGDDGLATYSVTTGGKITITFTEDIRNEGGQAMPIDNGKFDAAWALHANAKTGDLVKEYPFNIAGAKTFTLAVANPGGKTIEKRNISGHGNNPKTVEWQVDVNTNTKDISSLSLDDSLPVVPGSISIIELEPQITGNPTEGTDTGGYTLGNNSFPITFNSDKKAYRITYKTEVTNPTPGNSTISNTATLTGTGGGSSTATHSVYFDEPIKKSVANSVTYPAGTLQWTVEVNADGRDISGGVTVKDILTLPATTNSADGNLMAFDDNSVTFSPAVTNESIQVNGDELTIYFEPAAGNEETYTITYNTVDVVVDKNYTFTNKADLTYNGYTDEYTSGAKTGTVNHQMLTKTGQTGDSINYLAKTIDWTVTFNTSNYDAITPVVITDTFNSGGKYFRMYEEEFPTVNGFTLALTNPQDDGGRAYTSTGFTLTATGQVDSQVTFTYPTHFDSTEEYPSNRIINTASVAWTKNGQPYTNSQTATSTFNTFTANNGKKTGIYDRVNKAVEWELDVNYKEFSLPTAKIVDTFGDKQTMAVVDKSTVKVHLLNMSATPTVNSEFTNYTVTGTGPAGNYTGFTLDFDETITKAYRVSYTTVYNEQFIGEFTDGEAGKAKNTAEFTSAGNPVTSYDTGTSGLKSSPTVTNAGQYFEKKGRDVPGGVDYLEWKFELNKSQSHIKAGSTIQDTMNDGQVLVENFTGLTLNGITANRGTFEVKKRNYTRNGNNFTSTLDPITPSDLFTIAIAPDKKSFTLTLKEAINHEYEISYVTDISGSTLTSLSNTYTYNFIGMETKTDRQTISQNVTYEYVGGAANISRYNLHLTKKDGFTGDKLKDVKFGLYIGNIEVGTATTDIDGKLSFPEIKYGTYTLKELEAVNSEYSTEFKVDGKTEFVDEYTFTTEGKTKDLTLEAINKKTCPVFTLTVNYNGNPVQAGVNVVIKDNTGTTVVTTGKTNANGQIEFVKGDLPTGDYKVYDTKGNLLVGDINVLYLQGDCEATVTWAPGADMSCSLFTLTVKENGTAVGENMKITLQDATDATKAPVTAYTNAQGKIEYDKTTLPAGTYDVFNIKNEKIGTVEVEALVVCEAEVNLAAGSIKACPVFTLTVNDSSNNPREGAKIVVRDAKGHLVEGASGNTEFTTDANGKVTFPYVIEPGTYNVYEDNKLINSFTVKDTCDATVKPLPSGGGGGILPPQACENFTITVKQNGAEVGANVELTLKVGTAKVMTSKTDENGKIVIDKGSLQVGTYTAYDKDDNELGTILVLFEGECQAEVNLKAQVLSCEVFTVTVKQSGAVVEEHTALILKNAAGENVVSGSTDADGKMTFEKVHLPVGSYKAYDKDDKEVGTVVVSYELGDCEAVVDLQAPTKTCDAFTITVKQSGKVVGADVPLTLKDDAGKTVATGQTDKDANIVFDKADLPAGSYKAYDEDGKEVRTVVVSYDEGACQAVVDLLPKTCDAFTITVKESGTVVAADVALVLKDASGKTVATGKTVADGKIIVAKADLEKGSYTAYDQAGTEVGTVVVSYDEGACQAVVDLLPKTCDAFTITVKESGKVVADVALVLKDASGKTVATGKTDADGKIIVAKADLEKGTYTAYDQDGTKVGTVVVSYDEGACQAVVDLLPKTCEVITIKVVDKPNTVIEIKDLNGNTVATETTNNDGTATIPNAIPEGKYSVYVNGEKIGEINLTNTCEVVLTPDTAGGTDNPSNPGTPGGTDNPNTPGQPGTPGGSTGTDNPNTPGQPGTPGGVTGTDKPNTPGKPGTPGDSTGTDKPSTPGQPGTPGGSTGTDNPNTPGQPGTPGGSTGTDNPNTPGQPGTPGGSTGTDNPNKPEQPGTPKGTGDLNNKPSNLQEQNKLDNSVIIKGSNSTNGDVLPQTGESFPIAPMAAGFTLIAVGLWVMFRRTRFMQASK